MTDFIAPIISAAIGGLLLVFFLRHRANVKLRQALVHVAESHWRAEAQAGNDMSNRWFTTDYIVNRIRDSYPSEYIVSGIPAKKIIKQVRKLGWRHIVQGNDYERDFAFQPVRNA